MTLQPVPWVEKQKRRSEDVIGHQYKSQKVKVEKVKTVNVNISLLQKNPSKEFT